MAARRGYIMTMDDATLLELAARLARRAGEEILLVRARGFETMRKADRSPVTEADHAAERLILEALRREVPSIPAISEEEIEAGVAPEHGAEYWLIDPLDGTREFTAGRDEFTVNIGLIRQGSPVLGVVGVPAYGEVFGGMRGPPAQAWKETAAGRRPIRVRPMPVDGMHVMASRHHASDPRLDEFLADKPVAQVTKIGSALKMVRLAEGACDLYPRFGRTMEWDTAGPQAVLEAAGGGVERLAGGELRYGKPGWENPPFLCSSLAAA